jgi:hypothetical protein
MKREVLSFAAVLGVLILAAVGASAHGGFSLGKVTTVQSGIRGDDASGARTESPEPSESPEASPKPEPSEQPEATPSAEASESDEHDDGTGDDSGEHHTTATPSPSGEHSGGSD